jgi:hypothetical protein
MDLIYVIENVTYRNVHSLDLPSPFLEDTVENDEISGKKNHRSMSWYLRLDIVDQPSL